MSQNLINALTGAPLNCRLRPIAVELWLQAPRGVRSADASYLKDCQEDVKAIIIPAQVTLAGADHPICRYQIRSGCALISIGAKHRLIRASNPAVPSLEDCQTPTR
jgi:hypothetical protein